MTRLRIAPNYSEQWLEVDRPQTLSDLKIESLIGEVMSGKLDRDISDTVYDNFKTEAKQWILGSQLNSLTGLDNFLRTDICIGCTQFIDTIYMKSQPQILVGDYRYHDRLGNWGTQPGLLKEDTPLIIAMPFPSIGNKHTQMDEILNECLDKNIDVHIDGAWVTCSRDIHMDFNHPAIKSVAISLSKGLGLGWNRIGLRWTKESTPDAITIMNDFHMNNRALAMIGLHFLRNLQLDYLWKTHGDRNAQICNDFNLTPTKSIHIAMQGTQPVGIAPLIRYLECQKK
jgi:hypothetical protein